MMTRMAEQLRVSHRAQEATAKPAPRRVLFCSESHRALPAHTYRARCDSARPGLVAAIYGANVDLPGRDRLLGTLILIVGMVTVSLLSLISFAVLRCIQR